MLEVNLTAMRQLVEGLDYRPLFVTVSGAHLYGFPSTDSDVDTSAMAIRQSAQPLPPSASR
jgi:predicted nucleotidyltransferase